MRTNRFPSALLIAMLGIAPGVVRAAAPASPITARYLYQVSDNTGPAASSWASLAYDPLHKELYVIDRQDGSVGVFNNLGMEVYRFGQDSELGVVISLTVMEEGDLLVLALDKAQWIMVRCNFRGEPKERVELHGLTPAFAKEFQPDTIVFRAGKIFLAEKGTMKVAVADAAGNALEAHDFFRELELDKGKGGRSGTPAMHAFNVDVDGTMLFTVATLFKVFVVAPGGKVSSFGQRGGAPGKFNIPGGVARDERGNVYVSDVLKCAVLVFSDTFEFLGQFGERGWDSADLIAPLEIAVGDGKIFVSQSARRGVSVFEVSLR